jgi:uncharacterized protein (TIGR03382 family)
VNRHADATAVSLSLGICEPGEKQQHPNEPAAARNAIIQGTVEGQTWFAASGDNGANDCGQMVNVLAADFPSDIPEMMAIGGSELPSPAWNANHAITAYAQEVVWNDGTMGGAAGGGLSVLFPMPSYQLGLVPDGGRSIPDIAMMAGNPGVAIMVLSPPGEFFNQPTVGTSVASPLSAGMFALMASRIGCRLGDVHETLYALGRAQDAGTVVFHDIVTGNLNFGSVNGPAAAPGFDSASGWGSLDVAALAAAWPACPPLPDGGTPAPIDAGAPYTPCNAICDGGTMCQTLPDGPSTCALACDADGGCPGASVCNTKTIFTMNGPGQCVPGCQSDSDCAVDAGLVCAACGSSCIPKGSPGAHIGDGCTSNAQCPTGATCQDPTYLGFEFLPGGYCTEACDPAAMSGSCMCPAGSTCMTAGAAGQSFSFCFKACSSTADCGRTGYVCQKLTTGDSVCTPKCQNVGGFFDTCQAFPVTGACNQTSGLCGDKPDAGHTDAGQPDAGHVDAGPTDDTVTLPAAGGKIGPARAGCGCGEAAAAPLLLAMLGLLLRRRR